MVESQARGSFGGRITAEWSFGGGIVGVKTFQKEEDSHIISKTAADHGGNFFWSISKFPRMAHDPERLRNKIQSRSTFRSG